MQKLFKKNYKKIGILGGTFDPAHKGQLEISKQAKKKYKIIFTGGYANLFKTSIIRPFTIDKNITIKGIIEIFKENRNYLS